MRLQLLLASLALPSLSSGFVTPKNGMTKTKSSSTTTTTTLSVKRMPIMMPTQEPMVPYRAPGSSYDQFIGLKSRQLRDRKLWIARYIDEEASNSIISSLLYLQSESDKEDIKLYLNIPGANLRPALAIYDAISELKADGVKIATTNIALCAGMGALIAGAGTKGMRYSLPNARFLLQKTGMDQVFRGQATDIALEVRNIKKWNEKMNGEISRVTGQSLERIDHDLKRDFYLSSEEAVRYGLIDEVLLPMPGKRTPPSDVVDLGSFQSGNEQKYQGEMASSREDQQQQQGAPNQGMFSNGDDDDGPKIAKG
jgi:ATP-dependent Clp protease protease subunit